MNTYYTVMMNEPRVWGENKIVAKDINTFRKRWADVYKNNHKPDFRMRVWSGRKMLGDMMFKGKTAIWIKASDPDNIYSVIDPKTGKLRRN